MSDGPIQPSKTLQSRILAGSFVLLSGSGLTTVLSFAYNIVVARFLGPQGYGDATAVYTLLILVSALTLSFQIVSAKVVAQQGSPEEKYAVYRDFNRAAWACGIAVGVLLVLFRGAITSYLNLPDKDLVMILAVGTAFYIPLGSRRGHIQGVHGFRRLAMNLVIEGAVRLGGSAVMIVAGQGVAGVIAANSAAVAMAYFAAAPRPTASISSRLQLSYAIRESLQAIVFFAGQVLINNCGIVVVKHYLLPMEAGLYAAIAMVGRVIFTFSSAVVNTMFPIAAGSSDEERRDFKLLTTSLGLVLLIGMVFAAGLRVVPAHVWTLMLGAHFATSGAHSLSYLLALFAVTTVVYSLSVVFITYEMSYKIASTNWVQLGFGGLIVAGICRYHSSLEQVILVQLVLMSILLVIVAGRFLMGARSSREAIGASVDSGVIRLVRRVSEDDVIAEFLKSDFNNPAFHEYRGNLARLVTEPNLNDARENAMRRALLFIRHMALWKELPVGTEWHEVEVKTSELDRIRVFPRAQWRKLAQGNFSLTDIAERVRRQEDEVDQIFSSKIAAVRDKLLREGDDSGTVILIGVNENEPLTILDGNHRLLAATLATPSGITRLRFLCGLSPRMTECCWYNTNLRTLMRYGRNLVTHVVNDPEAELARLLQTPG